MTRPQSSIDAMRRYAEDLRATGSAYITGAGAVGMDRNKGRREAADYLTSEGQRLIREARTVEQIANEWEDANVVAAREAVTA